MVVTGTNGGCFCLDFGQVLLQGLTESIEVAYTVTHPEGSDSFTECYTPTDRGEVVIRDLGTLALSYFPEAPILPGSRWTGDRSVTLDAVVTAGDTELGTFSQTFYYANCRTNIPQAYKYRGFLARYRRTTHHIDQSNMVSFFQQGQTLGIGIGYREGSTPIWSEFPNLTADDSGRILTIDLSVDYIIRWLYTEGLLYIDAADVDYLIFYLKADGEVVDAIQVDIDHSPGDYVHLAYLNAFGVPDTLCFRGRETRTAELMADYVTADHTYRRINSRLDIYHEVHSGYITAMQRDCAEDLACSPAVYLYGVNALGDRITITEVNFEETGRPRTEPINVAVKYRLANETQRVIERDMTIDYRIFDHTFGIEFE